MKELFLSVLMVSLTCSLLLAPLLVFGKKLRSRYAAKTLYFLWLLLAIRMVLPNVLIMPQAPVTVEVPGVEVRLPTNPFRPSAGASDAPTTYIESTEAWNSVTVMEKPTVTVSRSIALGELAAWVWLTGMAVFLLWQMLAYMIARGSILRESIPATDDEWALLGRLCADLNVGKALNLCRSARVESPMLLGLFSPMVVLPDRDSDPDELEAVLRHELCHLKRGDVAYKSFFLLVNAIHWFNPLVWLMARAASRNVEFCCDDQVLRHADGPTRKHYGEVLLYTAAGSIYPAFSTHFGSGKEQLRERILNLFKPKKNSTLLVCAVAAVALLAGGAVAFESKLPEKTAPLSGEIYTTYDFMEQEENSDFETVKLHVVNYAPETDTLGEGSEARTFTMAEDVLVRRDAGGNSISPGEPGTAERQRELHNFFAWPMLRAQAYPDTIDLIELVLNEEGEVAQMTWIRTPKKETQRPVPTTTATPEPVERSLSASDETIAGLLETICSSPARMSNPGAYIEEHREEYDILLGYGGTTVDYCFRQFEQGGQTDLRGHIMAALCRELLGSAADVESRDGTGQGWYDAYMRKSEITTQPIEMPLPVPTASPNAPVNLPVEGTPEVTAEPLPPDTGESKSVIELSSGGQNSLIKSASFTAKAGQTLTLTITSDISGGTVDLFLFSPAGKQERISIGGEDMTKTITLTEGTWAYNCTGFFESGSIGIVGTVK